MTGAEFVKIIAGVAGADVTSAAGSSFSDVDAGAWYAPYVAWAAGEWYVTGREINSIEQPDYETGYGGYYRQICGEISAEKAGECQ